MNGVTVQPQAIRTLAIFCRVVDNFGDIGICYRLARQMADEHGLLVTLWVDDLASFAKICPAVDIDVRSQQVAGLRVVHWTDDRHENALQPAPATEQVADMVIEFFGCELPAAYLAAMKSSAPVWVNLEGLSAEEWVEGCHTLTSPQSGLTKYFFYPGFTAKTGGLLREASLLDQRDRFRSDPQLSERFLRGLGVQPAELSALRISLFCYAHAPLDALFNALRDSPTQVLCLVPQGVVNQQADAWLGAADVASFGSLTLRRIPFVPQHDYDRLLWSCDINFVRGEDSFSRAQWTVAPFVWHIYPQDQNLHHKKLQAYLQRCTIRSDSMARFWQIWNDVDEADQDLAAAWNEFVADRHKLANMAPPWQEKLLTNGDLATNLMQFSGQIWLKNHQITDPNQL
jgi:uncharacterized repeat protein (TIGR03837 family)